MPKFKISSLVASVLSVALITSSTTSFANANESNTEINKTWTETSQVISVGEVIGEVETTYKYSKIEDANTDSTANLTVSTHYELSTKATDIQKEEFSDHIDTYEFKTTNNGDYFVNGHKLTQEELNTPVDSKQPTDSLISTMAIQDTGGISTISHYYGDFTNYHLASYSGVSILARPKGANHQADGNINNAYVQRAMSAIDSATSSIKTMNSSRDSFMIAAAATVITLETVIAAIAAGGTAAGQAAVVYDSYNNANADLTKATQYIDQI